MTGERFAVSLTIATLIPLLATWNAVRTRPRGPWLVLAIAIQSGLSVNAIQHAGVAMWTGGYAPGMVTGLSLCLSYGVYLAVHAVRDHWVAVRPLLITTAHVLLLAAPFLMAAHRFSMIVR